MKLTPILLTGTLAAAIGFPFAAWAQQTPGQYPSYGQGGQRGGGMRWLEGINLTDQQKQQIQQLVSQYRQSHPRSSGPDPQSRQQLEQQIMNILTPDQQKQAQQNLQNMSGQPSPHS
jgi:Spy/CpxP family protein refolding chaperone